MPKINKKSIYLEPTDPIEILEVINQLKDKAGGIDHIHSCVIKKLGIHVAKPLTHIINLCIEQGIFPDHLKLAEIVPVYKKGDKSIETNYRPISLISNFAKILEKIIHKRLIKFLDKHQILSQMQFGFRKNIGTNFSLAYITEFLHEKLDKSRPTIAVFLDLAKAFDTVNHELLLKKIENYGIRGVAYSLAKNYLSNRKETVKINGK